MYENLLLCGVLCVCVCVCVCVCCMCVCCVCVWCVHVCVCVVCNGVVGGEHMRWCTSLVLQRCRGPSLEVTVPTSNVTKHS